MDPLKVSAHFAAFVWHGKQNSDDPSGDAAAKFARANWPAFLPLVNEGLGKLLLEVAVPWKVADRPTAKRRTQRASRMPKRALAKAG